MCFSSMPSVRRPDHAQKLMTILDVWLYDSNNYLCRFLKALEIKTKNTVAQGVNYVIVKEG
ncbi:MAG: hypothetical protein RLZZ339_64 [Cyanobacteriota bacterium]|jgi:hypothetical protein